MMAEQEIKTKKKPSKPNVHGDKGVYCGGDWIPIESCDNWVCPKQCKNEVKPKKMDDSSTIYDVAIIGAGCIGASIARQLSRYSLKTILLERDDDVTQGATKGNSGIIHAGYDDKPGSVKAQFCWNGNQMFPELDRQLKFGYLQNGSLVIARNKDEYQHLKQLYARGQTNGIQNLRIVEKDELHEMEPYLDEKCIAALYSPDAGTVTPYEYTIAMAENAAMNGVQIRTRHEVQSIHYVEKEKEFKIGIKNWCYAATSDSKNVRVDNAARRIFNDPVQITELLSFKALIPTIVAMIGVFVMFDDEETTTVKYILLSAMTVMVLLLLYVVVNALKVTTDRRLFSQSTSDELSVKYEDMQANKIVRSRYVINCAGLFSDKIANMIGDHSFKIKPRIGDYILLHKRQGHLARCTLFPCPDTKIGTKGILVQTTLWGNLILGPTARDVYKAQTQKDKAADIMKYILTKCKELVPTIDASDVIHSFAGARAKSDRGDWIIGQTESRDINFYNVAGIDSPGLAGSPAIAVYVVNELLAKKGGLKLVANEAFNPYRRPLIFPKQGWKGLKLKKVNRNINKLVIGRDEEELKRNVVCKCEKVTEYEILDAMERCGVEVDTTQAIRRRTRAGMGGCQASPNNCDCELFVAQLIAKKKGLNVNKVGRRPWPATSLLKKRWLNDEEKASINALAT